MDAAGRYLQTQIDEGRMPGAVWAVAGPRGVVSRGALGLAALQPRSIEATPDTLYDLASLTKPLATAWALATLEQRGTISLDAPVSDWLPELSGSVLGGRSLLELATHRAGLPAWRPWYLDGGSLEDTLRRMAREAPGPPGHPEYSDAGYLCLGAAVERIAGCPLDVWFERHVAAPLGLGRIGFATRLDCSQAAPTECGNAFERRLAGDAGKAYAWRTRMIRGEVHDANAWALGGVAGHAGLFGALDDVLALGLAILRPHDGSLGKQARQRLLSEAVPGSGRSVGLVLARASDAARGVLDDDAPGHVGFTGVSMWLDPARDGAYVLLTNRVHPRVDPGDFQPVRLGFHRAARGLLDA